MEPRAEFDRFENTTVAHMEEGILSPSRYSVLAASTEVVLDMQDQPRAKDLDLPGSRMLSR